MEHGQCFGSGAINFHYVPLRSIVDFWSLVSNLRFIRRCVARMSYVRTKLQITRNGHIPPSPPKYVTPKCICSPEERMTSVPSAFRANTTDAA